MSASDGKTEGLATLASSNNGDTMPMLSTIRNMLLIGFFNFSYTFCSAGNILFLWYFSGWKLSYIYFSLVSLISTVFTTYVQIGVGYYGDKVNTIYGRRKPLVVAGSILSIICTFLAAFPPSLEQNILFGWAVWVVCLLYASWIIGSAPYSSWMIESTNGPEDYRRITTICSPISSILGAAAGLLCSDLLPHSFYCLINFVLLAISTGLLVWLVPNPQLRPVDKQPDIIPSLRTCMRSKEFKTIFINKILLFGGISIGGSMLTYLLIFAYGFVEFYSQIATYLLEIAFASIFLALIFQLTMSCILAKFDKLKVYKIITIIAATVAASSFFVSLPETGMIGFTLLLVITVVQAALSAGLMLIDTLFVRDLVIYDTFMTGLKRENMYQMALGLPSGLAITIGVNIPLILCYMSGFVAGTNQVDDDQIVSKFIWDDAVIWQMRIYASFLVTVLCLISYKIIHTYPLNDKASKKINDIVNQRELALAEKSNINVSAKAVYKIDTEVPTVVEEPAEDIMFMNNFSQVEIAAFAQDRALLKVLEQKQIAGLVLAGIAVVVLCAATGLQIENQQGSFAMLNITISLLLALYIGYEALRFNVLKRLMNMPEGDQNRLITLAKRANEDYISKLAGALKKAGIDDTGAADTSPDDHGPRETLAQVDPAVEADLKDAAHLPGYKRLYVILAMLITYGIFGCTLLDYKSQQPHSHGNHTDYY